MLMAARAHAYKYVSPLKNGIFECCDVRLCSHGRRACVRVGGACSRRRVHASGVLGRQAGREGGEGRGGRMTQADGDACGCAGAFPVLMLHGAHDDVSNPLYAAKVAARLCCAFVLLPAAHWLLRECRGQVSRLILQNVHSGAELQHVRAIKLLPTEREAPSSRRAATPTAAPAAVE